MSNNISIGGVKFNKHDVQKSEQIEKDGKVLNSVFLKDGTQIVFPEQKAEDKVSVEQYNSQHNNEYDDLNTANDYHTRIFHMSDAQVIGTKKEDEMYLFGCKNVNVDVSNDYNRDYVQIQDGMGGYKSSGNSVTQGAFDISYIQKPESEQNGLFSKSDINHADGIFKERD